VVLTWLDGLVGSDPPASDREWLHLVEHFAAVHTITPEMTTRSLPEAVLMMCTVDQGIACVRRQLNGMTIAERPPALRQLMERLDAHAFPSWRPPPVTLCRSDPNIENMVRRPGSWASVDWENSGWGDPAFEIADLVTHAAYLGVPSDRWEWVVQLYARLTGSPDVLDRVPVYVTLNQAVWAARFGRILYAIPRGLDVRLTPWPVGWLKTVQTQYEHYMEAALRALT
jgi:aminoglycoside phosphotransferase (APT) family kinase protein